MGANGSIWEQMSSHVCSGVHFHGGGRKTRRNGAKSGGQDIFCRCGHEQEKHQVIGRGGRGGSERIKGECLHAKGGLGYLHQSSKSYVAHFNQIIAKQSKTSKQT